MLRLALTSDLHVDHHPEVVDLVVARARALDVQVLVVAGDLTPSLARLEDALTRLRDAAPRVVFVAGNHDLWCMGEGPGSQARYLDAIPAACARAGVDCLHHDALALPGVTVCGQTGWYDYSLRDPSFDDDIPRDAFRAGRFGKLVWTDKRYVRWDGLEDDGLTRWMAGRLAAQLAAAPRDRPIVAVTHVLPFLDLVPRRPLPWAFVSGFLGSAALGDAIVAAARDGAPITHALAGHTHYARSARVPAGERELVALTSPVGYPREYRGAGDLAARVVERVSLVLVPRVAADATHAAKAARAHG